MQFQLLGRHHCPLQCLLPHHDDDDDDDDDDADDDDDVDYVDVDIDDDDDAKYHAPSTFLVHCIEK